MDEYKREKKTIINTLKTKSIYCPEMNYIMIRSVAHDNSVISSRNVWLMCARARACTLQCIQWQSTRAIKM